MSFKRRSIIIRLWWRIINLIIRNRPTDLDGEDDFNKLMEEQDGNDKTHNNRN